MIAKWFTASCEMCQTLVVLKLANNTLLEYQHPTTDCCTQCAVVPISEWKEVPKKILVVWEEIPL
jgi:hypothetical protein